MTQSTPRPGLSQGRVRLAGGPALCYGGKQSEGQARLLLEKSKDEGYPARSVFKLQEIQQKQGR